MNESLKKLFAVLAALSLLVIASCKDDETEPKDDAIVAETFDLVLRGNYPTNVTIGSNLNVQLDGEVRFIAPAVLTIGAGTVIKGKTDDSVVDTLVILMGAKIQAVGTALNPIVFTSGKIAGYRASQDWGGISILGKATIDATTNKTAEGLTDIYGGTDDADNSGTLQYVRIEFAGKIYNANKELNGLALYGVGTGTTLNYVQLHRCSDDGIEFFGGTVNASHLVSTANEDDQIDCAASYRGTISNALSININGASCFEFDGNNNSGTVLNSIVNFYNVIALSSGQSEYGSMWRKNGVYTMYNSYFAAAAATNYMIDTAGTGTTSLVLEDTLVEYNSTNAAIRLAGGSTVSTNGTSVVTNVTALKTSVITSVSGLNDAALTTMEADTGIDTDWAKGWTSFPLN